MNPGFPLPTLRILAGALCTAPIVITLTCMVAVGQDEEAPPWATFAAIGLVCAGFVMAQVLGYRATPPTGATPAAIGRSSWQKFQASFYLRMVMTESPVMLSVALAFVVGHWLPLVAAAVFGVLSMAWHLWPSDMLIERYQRALEADGRPSYLREALEGRLGSL